MIKIGALTRARRLLALGAHAEDVEIGCGGTLLRLAEERPELEVLFVVFCAGGDREPEARASAESFLSGFPRGAVHLEAFPDAFLPYVGGDVKLAFERIKREFDPDVILTHYRDDRHQDHRQVAELTWNTWRNHLILEYEVPKYDGDLGSPSVFSELTKAQLDRKIELLLRHYPSQTKRPWFTPDLFRALSRIRGMECAAAEGFAEAFYCRKLVI